ncbi:MAG: glutathione S-transferase family protein [Deltaproteobacteria bacterium]|nr:glutathione S-transferase family protein [Deltaproteobacteria bacterium]
MPILHGVNASPFVRKVRVALAIKGIDYELNPVMPMGVSDEYKQKSPLGKIPCWEDGDFTLPDSSCIIAYLEKLQPEPTLYPSDPRELGRALFLEEYGDSKLAETVGPFFFERIVRGKIMKAEPDEARLAKVLAEELPPVFDWLESQVPESGDAIVGGRFSIADIGIATQLVNGRHAGLDVDASRWPRLAAYRDAVFGNPYFKPIVEEETAQFGAM